MGFLNILVSFSDSETDTCQSHSRRFQDVKEYADELEDVFKSLLEIREVMNDPYRQVGTTLQSGREFLLVALRTTGRGEWGNFSCQRTVSSKQKDVEVPYRQVGTTLQSGREFPLVALRTTGRGEGGVGKLFMSKDCLEQTKRCKGAWRVIGIKCPMYMYIYACSYLPTM